MKFIVQIDLFGWSAFLEDFSGRQILYTIESLHENSYCCFVQKRKSFRNKWGTKRLIEKTQRYIRFEYANTESGIKIFKQDN